MYNKILIEKFKEKKRFYVYAYFDPRKPGKYVYGEYSFDYEPFYIGKGTKNRLFEHLNETVENTRNTHKVYKIKRIQEVGLNPIVFKINENLIEQDSLLLEIKYIQTIGRSDLKLGPLTNQTDGGDGFSNLVERISGDKHYLFGKHLSEETKEKLRISKTGTKTSEETKKKQSKAQLGKIKTDETKKKMSIAQKGKFISEETRKKQSNAKIGKKQSKETIKKRTKSGKNHWHYGKKGKNSPSFGKKHTDKIKNILSTLKSKIVLQYDMDGNFIKEWNNSKIAAKELNISSSSNIRSCCRGIRKSTGGFIWKHKTI